MPQTEHSDCGKPARPPKEKSPKPDFGPTCGMCKHWVWQEGEEGLCYRNPPEVHFDEEGSWLTRPFPERSERACGEFVGGQ